MLVQQHRQQTAQSQSQTTTTSWLMNMPNNIFSSLWPSSQGTAAAAAVVIDPMASQSIDSLISFGGSPMNLAGNLLTNFLSGLFGSKNFIGFGDTISSANIHYTGPLWTFEAFEKLWLKELGSTTIQRLIQSMLIQIFYIISLIFTRDEEDEASNDCDDDDD